MDNQWVTGEIDDGSQVAGIHAGRGDGSGRDPRRARRSDRAARGRPTEEARAAAAKHDIAAIMQSLKLYRLDNGRYPTNEQGLQALVTKPQSGPSPSNWRPYLDKLPKDPWGNGYQFLNPGVHGEIDVFTLGADGQPGGTGADQDVGSWQL